MASQANPSLNLSAANFSASAAATFIPTASRALPLRAPQGQTASSSAWLGHHLGTLGLGLPYESHPLQAIRSEMFHSRGAAMIRATVVRALVLMAAFAPTLTPVRCLGEDGNQLPTKATKELPPELLSLFRQKKMPKHSPILMRIFKEDAELEVWKQDTTGHFQLLKIFPICRWSGDLGPKLHEGDRQAPEGFYTITPELMNPNSNFYLAINTGLLRQGEQPRRKRSHDPRRLLVERLLCHDRRTDERDLFAGARLTPRQPALIPDPGLSVPLDAGESGAASN
jgi:hypothetical protein